MAHPGPCECLCSNVEEPVCAWGGVTYTNECQAKCAHADIAREGRCGENCICPDVITPVCGTDGVTYNNGCEATCWGAPIAHPGSCDTTTK